MRLGILPVQKNIKNDDIITTCISSLAFKQIFGIYIALIYFLIIFHIVLTYETYRACNDLVCWAADGVTLLQPFFEYSHVYYK